MSDERRGANREAHREQVKTPEDDRRRRLRCGALGKSAKRQTADECVRGNRSDEEEERLQGVGDAAARERTAPLVQIVSV